MQDSSSKPYEAEMDSQTVAFHMLGQEKIDVDIFFTDETEQALSVRQEIDRILTDCLNLQPLNWSHHVPVLITSGSKEIEMQPNKTMLGYGPDLTHGCIQIRART